MQSIHLSRLPLVDGIPFNQDVISNMEFIRKVCSAMSSIRKKNNIKARLPLQSGKILGKNLEFSPELLEIIKDEANIKTVQVLEDFSSFNLQTLINIDAKKVAKRIGKDFQKVLKKAKEGTFVQLQNGIEIEGHVIQDGEYEIQLKLEGDAENYTSIDGKFLIMLDTQITPELEAEGVARDFIRAVQNARKEDGLDISDQITLKVSFKSNALEVKNAIEKNSSFVCSQVLAKEIFFVDGNFKHSFGEGTTFEVKL